MRKSFIGIGYVNLKGLNISRINNLKWAKMHDLAPKFWDSIPKTSIFSLVLGFNSKNFYYLCPQKI